MCQWHVSYNARLHLCVSGVCPLTQGDMLCVSGVCPLTQGHMLCVTGVCPLT